MSVSNTYMVMHILEGDEHDFNVLQIPDELLLPLSYYLKSEYQNRISRATQKSFREERALQHQRHLEHCKETGTVPQQQFIDFAV
ncbi:MAG TPA: hypothetical protein VHA56_03120 [Mucilaginibacter sp.]|nr:hypothetical protein [Mucilaginibacter sp.]